MSRAPTLQADAKWMGSEARAKIAGTLAGVSAKAGAKSEEYKVRRLGWHTL